MKKQNYTTPETSVIALNAETLLTGMSTGTNDNTGGNETGPGKGKDDEDAGAKFNGGSLWDSDEE